PWPQVHPMRASTKCRVHVATVTDDANGPGPPDPEVTARFTEFRRTRSRVLRNALVEEHAEIADRLARRFARRGEPLDDLRQVALLGLLKSVERFDPDRGLHFVAFATPTVVGEIKRHFRDRGWMVRVPRRIQELHLQLDATVSRMSQSLGRSPTVEEIAVEAQTRVDDVLEALEAGQLYRLESLDRDHRGMVVVASDRPDLGRPDPEFDAIADRDAVLQLLQRLPERERTILYLRYFEELTQAEISERVGISQMHVSRLLTRTLERLGSATATYRD
ncbi:MAG: sig1, partial [Actinomycetia bacterium]|nr:sig1 [Actinomycetes bacterium]